MLMDSRVNAVRGFNRFYTRQIGLLHKGYLKSPFSLTEVRVLYELAHRGRPSASEIGKELGLDAGYLSRMLLKFQRRGLVARKIAKSDGRRSHLSLTKSGQNAFTKLDRGAHNEIAALLEGLSAAEQKSLIGAMETIMRLLGGSKDEKTPYLLRPHQPGDMGWVIHRHGALYAQECGWDERFEALVAEIAARFVQNFDGKRERCWIAERDGAIVGSVFLVRQSDEIAKLRLLLVEPSARGLGIGGRLVDECIRFARQSGYKTITLWTQQNLLAAQRIYRKAGFRLVREERHSSFGYHLVGQTWELTL
jgi:DNA-binding MarR family transcriptional regulator/GNAT superfamily N-acetyltransferase